MRVIIVMTIFLNFLLTSFSFANGTGQITEYYTDPTVRVIVAILGGLISVLGIVVVLKGIGDQSDVEISMRDQAQFKFKRISQGVVIVLVGAAILIAAVYFLPEKTRVVDVEGKAKYHKESGKETMETAK